MAEHVDVGGFGFLDGGADVVLGELGAIHAVRRGRDAPAQHQLDVLCAAFRVEHGRVSEQDPDGDNVLQQRQRIDRRAGRM